ncbi:MAG TPA: hypothetical protein VJC37_01610 [Planctomycetota bacterium]|nr:hypothetical protein [Planctomycetota bacterium]
MKTLLCIIVAIGFLTLPVLAEDVKVDFKGSRLAAGYMDNGKDNPATVAKENPGTFGVPDAKARFNVAFDEDTSAVLRLTFSNAVAGGADYAYVKVANVIKKMAKNDMVNPDIYVGKMKINFGEETFNDNPVEGALVQNSIGLINGYDMGVEFRQKALPIELPVVLGYAVGFGNGNTGAADGNNTKAYTMKVMATMKSMPLYFSLSQYGSGNMPAANTAALGSTVCPFVTTQPWYMKGYELDVRYDMLEGAQKFDPAKAPLFSDAKGVFRLAYGTLTLGATGLTTASNTTRGNVMLDAIYNVDKQWYVAFRYSYTDVDVKGVTTGDVGKTTRMSVGGGHRLSDSAILKLDYTTNAEADTVSNPKLDNDSVSLLMTVKW